MSWMLISLGILAYAYLGYPALLGLASRFARVPIRRDPLAQPSVTVLIAAYNEERHITERLENLSTLRYPAEKLHVLVGSDGSSDQTAERARLAAASNTRILEFPERRGKIHVLNRLAAEANTEILAFSDANTLWEPSALERLVATFADPSVGGVSGRLRLRSTRPETKIESDYWDLESRLKGWESQLGTTIGANGAIYAIRASLWRPLPEDRPLMDDFVIGARVVESGSRMLFEPEAVAWESTTSELGQEIRRKRRIFVANFCAVPLLWRLLLPGRAAWFYTSRKLLRWLTPAWLIGLGIGAWEMRGEALGQTVFALGGLSAACWLLYRLGFRWRGLALVYYVLSLQWELARAFLVAAFGRPPSAWERSAR